MQNILRYLTPEILAWESGNIREVRPLGSVLCLPDGAGVVRLRLYPGCVLRQSQPADGVLPEGVRRMGAGQQSGGYPLRRAAVSY